MQTILEILGKVGFDWRVALANFVNFLIIFYLLKRFAFGPIKKVINERQNKIQDGLDNAKKAETALLLADKEKEKIIDKAKEEASGVLVMANKRGEEIVSGSEIKGREEYERLVSSAKTTIEKEKERAEEEVKEKTANLIVTGIEKILREKIDKAEEEKIIKKVVAGL